MKHFYLKFTKKTFIHLFLGMSLLLVSQGMMAQKTSSGVTSDWSLGTTWVGGVVPNTTELVTIAAGHTVNLTLTANTTIGSLNVQNTGTLTITTVQLAAGPPIVNSSLTITNSSTIAGNLTITGPGGRNIGNLTVNSTGIVSSTGGSTSLRAANTTWTNDGTFTTANLGYPTDTSRIINNNSSFTITSGIGSTGVGVFNNNSGATLTFTGAIAGTINNFGTMIANSLTTAGTVANINNKSTGVLNFAGGSMPATMVLDASEAGNTVNYNGTTQTVKVPLTSYNKLILSNSGTKTIPTAASGTLCSGTLTISGAGGGSGVRASVTNAGVKVNMLILNTTGQVSTGTIGITASSPATVNNTYFVTGTGTIDVQKTYAFTSTAAGGNWNTASTWVDGAVPANSSADYVVIVSGSPVSLTLGSNFTVGALDINSGGTLNVTGAFTFTIASRAPFSNIAGNLNLDSTTGSKSFGNITVAIGGIIDSLGGSTSIATTATAAWVNNGTIGVTTLGLTTGEAIENNGTFSCTGVGSGGGGVFNNNSTGTFTLNGATAGIINNFGIMNSTALSGTAVIANLNNKATGVLNFTGDTMAASNLVLDASEAGNTVNYSRSNNQTVKDVVYSTLGLSGSGTKTIPTAASGTLSTGTLTIAGTAKATVTNTNVAVNRLFLGTTEQFAGTIGGSTSGAATINTSYFNAGAGTLNAATGVTETTWNGTSWSPAAPTAAIDAIINGTYATTSNGAINSKSLTVNATRALTINSGTNVTVQNAVVNNGTMTIQNNANLIQVNNVTNSGSVTVNRNGSTLKRLDYTLWSSPVAPNQTLKNFSQYTVDPRFYQYLESSNKYSAVDPAATTFATGKGYLIRMPDQNPAALGNGTTYYAGTTTLSFAGAFVGVLNNGDIPVTLTKTDELTGYQAVGNPYPSVIKAQEFVTANTANIENTLYFWRKTNGAGGSAYATWTSGGSTTNEIGVEEPNGKIQVGQGFIVRAKDSRTVTNFFTNAMRDEAPSSTQFFKTKQQAQKDRVWLNLTNTSGAFSQALVAYIDDATLGLDKYDGKYINDSGTALTTSIAGDEYTIQGRPAFDTTDVVALNFKTSVAGTYTIAIDHVDGLFSKGQDIYLVDKTTGTTTNLNEGAYTFTAAVGVDNTRFTLTYQKTLKVDAPLFNESSVLVSRNNGTLNVKSSVVAINNVKVYDVQGRLVAERKNVKSNTATIGNLRTNQVLIVKVTSENNAVVTKKVLN